MRYQGNHIFERVTRREKSLYTEESAWENDAEFTLALQLTEIRKVKGKPIMCTV